MNNKGFMMAELVVVSAIVLVALSGLYVSYNKIFSIYNKRINYYDVATLYELGNIRDNNDLTGESSMANILNKSNKKVYYLNHKDLLKLNVSNQTYKEYLEYISGSVTFDTEYILVMEICLKDDINICKYAYLEVF